MNWKRIVKYTGFLGASVCGVCVARTCAKSYGSLTGTLSAEAGSENGEESSAKLDQLAGLTLRQVHVYFRHGARTPIHLIPGIEQVTYSEDMLRTPPHINFKHDVFILPDMKPRSDTPFLEEYYKKTPLKGGTYAGNLTSYGKEQMYNLGLELRRVYGHAHGFLPADYHPDDVFVQSTNINRTIASACCVLAGLYGKESLNANGAVPIPVTAYDDEVLFPNSHKCAIIRKVNHAANKFADHIPGIYDDRRVIETALGYTDGEMCHFVPFRDDLIARQTHGYRIPAALQPHMEMIEKNAIKVMYYSMCGQHEAERPIVTRLGAGPALHLMMQGMEKLQRGEKSQKIFLYSAHDSTMVALLEGLGLFDWKWPPFAAELRMELYQDAAGEHWVRTIYLGQERTLRGCSSPVCCFSEFKKNLSPYIIPMGPEYDKICATNIKELVKEAEDELEKASEAAEMSEIPAGM